MNDFFLNSCTMNNQNVCFTFSMKHITTCFFSFITKLVDALLFIHIIGWELFFTCIVSPINFTSASITPPGCVPYIWLNALLNGHQIQCLASHNFADVVHIVHITHRIVCISILCNSELSQHIMHTAQLHG